MNRKFSLIVFLLVFGSANARQQFAFADTASVKAKVAEEGDIQAEEQIQKLCWTGRENFYWRGGIGISTPKKMPEFNFPAVHADNIYSPASVPKLQKVQAETSDNSNSPEAVLFRDSVHTSRAFFFALGLTDWSMGFHYRFGSAYAVGIRWGGYYMGGSGSSSLGFNSGRGIGVKISRSFQYKALNTVNCEYMFLFDITDYSHRYPLLKGGALEVNVGYENKYSGGFLWAIGAVVNSGKSAPLSVLPIVKVGFIINV